MLSIMVMYKDDWSDVRIMWGEHYIEGESYTTLPYSAIAEPLVEEDTDECVKKIPHTWVAEVDTKRIPLVLFDNKEERWQEIAAEKFTD